MVKTQLTILTTAVVGWGLSDGSSTIRTIFPKDGRAMNAGAFRKEGSKWKPEQTAKRRKSKVRMEKMHARKIPNLRSQSGFTLLEMMSVLVIIGVIFSVTTHRFADLSDTASQKAIASAIRELNIRETLTWYDFKISTDGWENDTDVFNRLDTKLGEGFHWDPAAGEMGGSLNFGNHTITLTRIHSTNTAAGSWE